MTPLHRSSAFGPWRFCARVAVLLCAVFASSGASFAQEPVTAVFKAHEIAFQYRSYTSFFPCHELENAVAVILRAVGARDDISVKATNCDSLISPNTDPMVMEDRWGNSNDPWGSDRWGRGNNRSPASGRSRTPDSDRMQMSSVRIHVLMPIEVTPEILAEIDKDKSRRELVSRVTGNPAAAFNDPVVFAAQRQEVTLSQKTLRLEPEHCELLEQMTRDILRRLDVRVTQRRLNCNGRELSRLPPVLTVESLMPTGALLPMPTAEQLQKENQVDEAVEGDRADDPGSQAGQDAAEPIPPGTH